jgi:hypothetical protein
MRIHFRPIRQGPERLLSEAEIHFEEGPLAGMRLLGFRVWRDEDGALFVTFPSRVTVKGGARLYIDYLRGEDGEPEAVRRVKAWMLEECLRQARLSPVAGDLVASGSR